MNWRDWLFWAIVGVVSLTFVVLLILGSEALSSGYQNVRP